ncbi:STM4012 family radical SAM protein [Pseudosporangium ferrugineum]|uniref:Heme chaperone HemW n=1 Tax=Pseudosporangium ferrugineum TaxID=439699 RepID=A0A2T0REH2_9ACTN|nr:STM4012 family radical SAM protein [Pseudosporangium ferrugineum]PRY19557.1 oxygen-independent coproporphyrinogen-3 oxidase [Pseudosporangium ferrugineum]
MSLDSSPYQGYLYAYPHKSAYRRLDPRPLLRDVWAGEPQGALFAYVHVPFCEMRCGFCNLFTRAHPPAEQVTAYLAQLRRQALAVREAMSPSFSQLAVGGGTPTYLTAAELEELFAIVEDTFGASGIATSVETSPATATPERLAVLRAHGTTRVSIGVQSFVEAEARAAVRPQKLPEVFAALDTIRASGTPALNIDLIYGIDGQTRASWRHSLEQALRWKPEELFLYPLYVRPLTGLGRRGGGRAGWDAQRQELYRDAVELLTDAGYTQQSMRQFRAPSHASSPSAGAFPSAASSPSAGPDYSCQDDGMVGLGCGARSYTRELHYSFDYAVAVPHVRAVIDDYLSRPPADLHHAEYGFRLDAHEQRRRWLLQSLLRVDGVDASAYEERFTTRHDDDFPELAALVDRGWLHPDHARLTPEGLAHSDAIGPWLTSAPVRAAMATSPIR